MKTTKIIIAFTFSLFTSFANAQLNHSNLDHWILLVEETTFDNVKTEMPQLDYKLESEKTSDAMDVLVFVNNEQDKFVFIYENKKLKTLAGSVFVMSKPLMESNLKDKGFLVISKEKVKKDGQKKEVVTWGKTNHPYTFVFTEGGTFQSILEIKIDASVVTDVVNLEEMPPIQIFLDKIEGKTFEENSSISQNISQKMTNNSFIQISKHVSSGKIYKSEVKEISWKNFEEVETYTLKNEDKYIGCTFYFENNLKKKSFSNDEEFGSYDNYNYFTCFIYAKDKNDFLKVIKDWENSRN
jgi:hypothetical protein